MKLPIFKALIGIFLCSGCATSYESSGLLSGGYSETKLAPDVVRVVFHGNTSTSKERVQNLALLRAADLSLQAGFPYFTVVQETYAEQKPSEYDPSGMSTPKTQILVKFLKEKSADGLTYDSAFLIQSLKAKYNIK